eukprot:5089777-Pleurochrysis_carterae.AAC.1
MEKVRVEKAHGAKRREREKGEKRKKEKKEKKKKRDKRDMGVEHSGRDAAVGSDDGSSWEVGRGVLDGIED